MTVDIPPWFGISFLFWIDTVFDASAKIPAGILNGNVNQFGDFDQCLQGGDRDGQDTAAIQGKYCLAYLQPEVVSDSRLNRHRQLHRLIQSHGAFRSEFNDVSIAKCIYMPGGLRAKRLFSLIQFKHLDRNQIFRAINMIIISVIVSVHYHYHVT